MSQDPELTAMLNTVRGLKQLLGGGFLGLRARRNHAVFTRAREKGVTPATVLATRDFGDDGIYHVVAFSTGTSGIDPGRLAQIRHLAEGFADELRAHGYPYYDTPTVWDGDGTLWISRKSLIRDLSVPAEDLYVFPLQQGSVGPAGVPKHVAWAMVDGKLHIVVPG
jgi:hypothetical protein